MTYSLLLPSGARYTLYPPLRSDVHDTRDSATELIAQDLCPHSYINIDTNRCRRCNAKVTR